MADEIAKTVPTAGPKAPQTPAHDAGYPEPVILEERIIAPAPKKEAPLPSAAPLAVPPQKIPSPVPPVSAPKREVPPEPHPSPRPPEMPQAAVPKIMTPPASFMSRAGAGKPAARPTPAPEPAPAPVPSVARTPLSLAEEVGLATPSRPAPASTPGKVVQPPVSHVMPTSEAAMHREEAVHEAPPTPITFSTPEERPEPSVRPAVPAELPSERADLQKSADRIVPSTAEPAGQKPLRDDIEQILKGIKLPERRETGPSSEPKQHVIENKPISLESAPPEKPVPAIVTMSPEKKAGAPNETLTPVHTLKDDLQDVVRDKKISLVRAAALEEDKRRGQEHITVEQREIVARRSRRTRAMLFAAGVLVALGALALGGVLYVESQHSNAPAQLQAATILFSEQSVAFPISNQNPRDLKQLLAQARSASAGSLGSITRIVPVLTSSDSNGKQIQTPATLTQFFTALGINAPDELLRAVGPDFFFGIHTLDKNAPLFVIPVSSYDHAFAGMLQWEGTMNTDLAPVFTAVPALTLGPDGLPVARTFSDGILQNYDVRELKDDQGTVQLYYSFPTPNLLIIAESPYSFTEILSRLQAERKL